MGVRARVELETRLGGCAACVQWYGRLVFWYSGFGVDGDGAYEQEDNSIGEVIIKGAGYAVWF